MSKKEKVSISKWFVVKIYQNFDFYFFTSSSFWYLSVVIFNMKKFCEYKLIKKIKKSQKNHWRQGLKKWKLYLSLYFLIFWRKTPSIHHKMVSHCVIIKFIILIPVITNFLTISPTNKKVSVLWAFFLWPIQYKENISRVVLVVVIFY